MATVAETLEGLAVRCEGAAAAEQYDLIGDAWDALGPTARWTAEQAGRFGKMMDAGAFESAAMMMVPDHCVWTLSSGHCKDCTDGWFGSECSSFIATADYPEILARSPALALCAAALRAAATKARES